MLTVPKLPKQSDMCTVKKATDIASETSRNGERNYSLAQKLKFLVGVAKDAQVKQDDRRLTSNKYGRVGEECNPGVLYRCIRKEWGYPADCEDSRGGPSISVSVAMSICLCQGPHKRLDSCE